MNLYLYCHELTKVFYDKCNLIKLAKSYLLIEGKPTIPVPSYILHENFLNIIFENNIYDLDIAGICITDTIFVNSALYWFEQPLEYVIDETVQEAILNSNPSTHILANDIYKLAKTGVFFKINFDIFNGVLISWDYILNNDNDREYYLNLHLLTDHKGKGLYERIALPKSYEMLNLNDVIKNINICKFDNLLSIIIYSLNTDDLEIINDNGIKIYKVGRILGDKLRKIKNTKNGYWKGGYMNLYWCKINGVRTPVHKYIQPHWVSYAFKDTNN